MIRDLHERYSPLYFLAALGFGGMSVLFFMNLMHLTPHPDSVMPTFDSIFAAWATGNTGYRAAIIAGYAGFIPFFLAHLYLLVWNLREFFAWRRTDAYTAIRNSNAEVTLMAVPLTLGMTVNGLFIAGMIFVPGLWNVIEYLMPLAIVLYGSVGILALTYLSRYLVRVMHNGFDFKANGGLNQLLSSFAFTMVAVGLAAPAAMTTNPVVVVIAGALSLFFTVIAILLFLVFLPLGAMSMLRYGLSLGNSATLWLGVPIITLLAITYLRLRHGVVTVAALNPNAPAIPGTSVWLATLLALMVAAQLAFLGLGHLAMTSNGFYKRFVFSRQEQSPAAFTLVCPGVALSVLTFFLLNVGLVKNNIFPVGSVGFVALLVAAYAVQAATLVLMASLVKNQLLRAEA
ncbi:TsoY family (seleno)protein [Trueperella pyogenes]|uniref:Beta-carotene 15,15'-monooxygenase n=1 Tax=Trueperella pyogenes TaxID=1661 RepID=A0ABV3N9T5_9ACTO